MNGVSLSRGVFDKEAEALAVARVMPKKTKPPRVAQDMSPIRRSVVAVVEGEVYYEDRPRLSDLKRELYGNLGAQGELR